MQREEMRRQLIVLRAIILLLQRVAVQPEETRRQLIGRVREQKREIAQLIQDIESWNDNNRRGESVDVVGENEDEAFEAACEAYVMNGTDSRLMDHVTESRIVETK